MFTVCLQILPFSVSSLLNFFRPASIYFFWLPSLSTAPSFSFYLLFCCFSFVFPLSAGCFRRLPVFPFCDSIFSPCHTPCDLALSYTHLNLCVLNNSKKCTSSYTFTKPASSSCPSFFPPPFFFFLDFIPFPDTQRSSTWHF